MAGGTNNGGNNQAANGAGSTAGPYREYEVVQELGRGAMGVVMLARHRTLGREVAIKELPPAFAANPAVRERFVNEARTVARLDHPHVVVIHDFIDADGRLALVMEKLPGGTVWDLFVGQGLTPAQACALMLSTAAGLQHAHENGVLHRDVKPENLMFAADGQLKVTDFGIAQVVSGRETQATTDGQVIGTPAYMAPEQADGQALGPTADVYACGTMLFEMLTGELPFDGQSADELLRQRVDSEPRPVRSLQPAVDPRIAAVVDRSLARTASDRYPSTEAMAVALGGACADAWGPEWLAEVGTAVRGAEAIERAARTPTVQPGTGTSSTRSGDARDDAADTGADTPHNERRVDASATAAATAGIAGDAAAGISAGAAAAAPPPVPVAEQVARRGGGRRRIDGADLNNLTPDDIVSISRRRPRGPASAVVPAVLTLFLLACLAGVVLGNLFDGADPTGEPVTVNGGGVIDVASADFSETVRIGNLGNASTVEITPRLAGVPLGSATADVVAGEARIDPGYLEWTAVGRVDLDVTTDGADAPLATLPVEATNPWWRSVPAVAVALAALFGIASVLSNRAGLRAGRLRVGAFLGLGIAGAVGAAGIAGLVSLARTEAITMVLLVVAAILGALAALTYGETYRRLRKRRRTRP